MVYTRSDREIKMIAKSCQIVADTMEMISDYQMNYLEKF